MTNPEPSRQVEIKDDNEQTAAVASVSAEAGPEGTVRASMYAKGEHVRPGDRATLVDAVMDLPEVEAASRLEAAVPFGDSESLDRLRERTEDAELRPAGASTLLDANVPRPRGRRTGDAPDDPLDPAGQAETGQAGPGQPGDEPAPGA
jgi:hypothetical protein